MVLLYRELADSFVVKHLPDYISRVDQKGYFRINNVKSGNYRLYALKDADNSKNYNFPEEEFAFMNSPGGDHSRKEFHSCGEGYCQCKKRGAEDQEEILRQRRRLKSRIL